MSEGGKDMQPRPDLQARLEELRLDGPVRPRDLYYEFTYPILVQCFRNLVFSTDNERKICGAIAFMWTWMAPMPLPEDLRDRLSGAIPALRRAREGHLDTAMVGQLRVFVDSLVGTSKLLHFINQKFPIWDRYVARGLYDIGQYRLGKWNRSDETYLTYCLHLREVSLPRNLEDQIHARLGDVNDTRCKEFALFQLGLR